MHLTKNMLWREIIRGYADYLCDPTVRGRYHSDDFPIVYYHEQNDKAWMTVKIENGILPFE